MKNLAPDIKRQRLLIEGFYSIDVNKSVINRYLNAVTKSLSLKKYGNPIIFSPAGEGKADNQGYDAFVPLIDSGISLYVWTCQKFFSVVLYTCKYFDEIKAVQVTKKFFRCGKVEFIEF